MLGQGYKTELGYTSYSGIYSFRDINKRRKRFLVDILNITIMDFFMGFLVELQSPSPRRCKSELPCFYEVSKYLKICWIYLNFFSKIYRISSSHAKREGLDTLDHPEDAHLHLEFVNNIGEHFLEPQFLEKLNVFFLFKFLSWQPLI